MGLPFLTSNTPLATLPAKFGGRGQCLSQCIAGMIALDCMSDAVGGMRIRRIACCSNGCRKFTGTMHDGVRPSVRLSVGRVE